MIKRKAKMLIKCFVNFKKNSIKLLTKARSDAIIHSVDKKICTLSSVGRATDS